MWPLGDFLPASSSVGGASIDRLTLEGVPHAGGRADLVPSSTSAFSGLPPSASASLAFPPHTGVSLTASFPGLPPPTCASSPMLKVYWSLQLTPPPHAGSSLPLGMSVVGDLVFLGPPLVLLLPPAASSPPQLCRPNLDKDVLPMPCHLLLRSGSQHASGPTVTGQSRVFTPSPFRGCPKRTSQWLALQQSIWGEYAVLQSAFRQGYHGGRLLSSSSVGCLGPASSSSSIFCKLVRL